MDIQNEAVKHAVTKQQLWVKRESEFTVGIANGIMKENSIERASLTVKVSLSM